MPRHTASTPLTVFYSYSHADERLRVQLEKHLSLLERASVISGWHFRKITAGREWEGDIDEHLKSARVILLLLSEEFIASDYCYDIELKLAMKRHDAGEARVIPVLLHAFDWKIAPFAKLNALPTNAKPVTSWRNRHEAFADVAIGIRKAIEEMLNAPPTSPPRAGRATPKAPASAPIWNVPHLRNPNFTGREDLLKTLGETLSSGGTAAVTQAFTGLGGVGKTQLAIEYCYRHRSDYEVTWWVRSEEPAALAADYAALAEALGLPEKEAAEQPVIIDAVKRWLGQSGGWLLVFDNAPEPGSVRDYLPGGAGHVLVTSRDTSWRGLAEAVPVPMMKEGEAVDFLLKRTGQTDAGAAAELAKELGYLPLALEQAAAYMDDTGRPIGEYLTLFKERQSEMLRRGKPATGYEHTVATTWELAFERVTQESPAAADLLRLCAYMAPDGIPRDLISEGADLLPKRLASAVADDLEFDDLVAWLRRFSLVEATGQNSLSVHRLVQAVTRERLAKAARSKWAHAAVSVVNNGFPYDSGDVRTWDTCSRLLPHALASAALAEEVGAVAEPVGRLLNQIGVYLKERAEFGAAKSALQRALRIGEAAYGPDHPTVAIRVNNLGRVLQDLGDLAPAQVAFERALRIDEATYGPNHPEVATDVNNLGTVLRDLGDVEGARAAFERALRIDEMAYGPNHPEVATRVSNLGGVLRHLGDLKSAREAFERALRIYETAYGPEHPNVATILNNLGSVLRDLGDVEDAREAFERALRIDEAAYGPDHPTVAAILNNLGHALQDLGDFKDAREALQRAYGIFRRFLGDEHPRTMQARRNLEIAEQHIAATDAAKAAKPRARKSIRKS